MLKNAEAFSSFSTDDIGAARDFYGGKLGLEVKDSPMGTLELVVGGGQHITIYPKPNHEAASFTVLNFIVPNVERAVDDLTAKGIKMEHYNMPEIKQDSKGIARDDQGPAIAWFKDPADNVVAVMEIPQR